MRVGIEQITDLSRGAAFLGTGGGGDPWLGALMLEQALTEHGPVELIPREHLSPEGIALPVAMMGAPTVLIEKFPSGDEAAAAVRAIERELGARVEAIACAEIGGINATLPLAIAARLGLPVVDGDGMGRAFPQLQMVTFHVHGNPAAPMVMVDEYDNAVLLNARNDDIERLARHVVMAMGGSAVISLYPMTGTRAREAIIPGTVSQAIAIGAALREGRHSSTGSVSAALECLRDSVHYGHACELFAGRIVDLRRETRGGFAVGEVRITGFDDHHATFEVIFQNENLLARDHTGRVRAIVPDLIVIVDAETGEPITTEGLRYGQRVRVLGVSAPPMLLTPAALEVMGPHAFGLDEPYTALEALQSVNT